jgi:hypothetical protein
MVRDLAQAAIHCNLAIWERARRSRNKTLDWLSIGFDVDSSWYAFDGTLLKYVDRRVGQYRAIVEFARQIQGGNPEGKPA